MKKYFGKCRKCGSSLVEGRKLTEKEKRATQFIAPLGSQCVIVCPTCYPEKLSSKEQEAEQ